MADIKLGTDTLSGVDTIQVRSAADDSKYVQYKTQKEGTTILNTQTYDKIYLNPNVTYDEVKAVYDSLTKQTINDITGYIIAGYDLAEILGDSKYSGYYGVFAFVQGLESETYEVNAYYLDYYSTLDGFASYNIHTRLCVAAELTESVINNFEPGNSWIIPRPDNTPILFSSSYVLCARHFGHISLNGLPIGEENEKLKNIFSATPFI